MRCLVVLLYIGNQAFPKLFQVLEIIHIKAGHPPVLKCSEKTFYFRLSLGCPWRCVRDCRSHPCAEQLHLMRTVGSTVVELEGFGLAVADHCASDHGQKIHIIVIRKDTDSDNHS